MIEVTADPKNSQENRVFRTAIEPLRELDQVSAMILALELHAGMVIRVEQQIYKIIEVESKAGAAKMGGVVRTKLINLRSGRMWEPHFRPQERVEDIELERHTMEFLFADGDGCTFMRPDTFEQIEVPAAIVGDGRFFLQSGMQVPIEFFEGAPISVVLPDVAEARVVNTASPSHSQQDSAWKEAVLENGFSSSRSTLYRSRRDGARGHKNGTICGESTRRPQAHCVAARQRRKNNVADALRTNGISSRCQHHCGTVSLHQDSRRSLRGSGNNRAASEVWHSVQRKLGRMFNAL